MTMTPEEFKTRAQAWLAIVQIVAIVAAGGWTVYQWNRTIFPKESHLQQVRAAEKRTDVTIVDPLFSLGTLVLPTRYGYAVEIAPSSDGSGTDAYVGVPTLAVATATLRNDRPFPVELTVSGLSLSVAMVPVSGDEPSPDPVRELDVAEVFGPAFAQPRILESGGQMVLAGQTLLAFEWCCPMTDSPEIRLAQLDVTLSLRGLSPETSEPVPGATKTRNIRFRSLFYRDLMALSNPVLAGAINVNSVASTDSNSDLYGLPDETEEPG